MPRQNSKSQPKSIASALLAGALIITLTGCANGDDAPTRMIKQVTDGVEAVSGEVKATNVLLVAQADGSAVLIATVLVDVEICFLQVEFEGIRKKNVLT